MKTLIWLVSILLISCASPQKEILNGSNFEVVNFGTYITQTDYKEDLDTSPTGKMTRSGDRIHLEKTTSIPPIIDTRFGVEYMVRSNNSRPVKLKFKWIPSSPIIGKSGKEYREISYEKIKKTNYLQYAGYILSIESELKTESWTLQIIFENDVLYEQAFFIN